MENQWNDLKQNYDIVLKDLKDLVVNIHHGREVVFEINEVLRHKNLVTIKKDITQLEQQVNAAQSKTTADKQFKRQIYCLLQCIYV